MKFTAIQEHLSDTLQIVGRAISNKNALPILQGVCFHVQNGLLTLTATDMEIRIEAHMPVEVFEEGSTVIQGKALQDFVRRLPKGPIMFESSPDQSLTIRYKDAESRMQGWAGEDYPMSGDLPTEVSWTLPARSFKNLVQHTAFAVRADEIRPVFTGLLFEIRGHDLTVVGTDSFRLTFMKESINNRSGQDHDLIIPVRALQEVSRLAGDEDLVQISVDDHKVVFQLEQARIISQRIQGEYPPYGRVIPDSYHTFCKIKRSVLLESLDRAMIFSTEKSGTPSVFMRIEGRILSIYTESETGMVQERLDIYQEGDNVDITFNAHFIYDALKNLTFEDLDVTFSGFVGPCVVRPANDDSYLYLLLPLRR